MTTRRTGTNCLLTLWGVALLGALWLEHRVAFDAPFYFDSYAHLVQKTNLHMVEWSARSIGDAVHLGQGGMFYRPLSNLSLAATHRVAGLTPRAYRIGNLAIHWLAALALLFLFRSAQTAAKTRVRAPPGGADERLVAVLAVSLWALHPVQTNVVTYVIQRMASMAGLFSFVALGAYLRARAEGWSWGWGSLAAGAWALALGSKETAVVCALLAAAAEWVLLVPPVGRPRRILLALAALGGLVAIAFAVWKGPWAWDYLSRVSARRFFTPWERLLTEARVQFRYLRLLLVPDPGLLLLDADVPLSRGLLTPPQTLPAAAGVLLAVGSAVVLRRRRPLLSLGILWFFLAQAVESTIVPLELYYEHRLYVASTFLFLGAAWALLRIPRRVPRSLAAAAILALYLLAGHQRDEVWANPLSFWADAVLKTPRNPRVYTNFCQSMISLGHYADAEIVCRRALQLGADPVPVLVNLATAAHHRGDDAGARRQLEAALAAPGSGDFKGSKWLAHRGLAALLIAEGRLDAAETHLSAALREQPGDPESWSLLGGVSLLKGDLGAAQGRLLTSLRFDATFDKAWNNLGAVYFKQGRFDLARDAFERACRYAPGDVAFARNVAAARSALRGSP